jgi:chromatin remodeling complex protein RSC6
MFDVRKPVSTYVEGKLDSLLNDIFEVRRKVEKTLSRNELLAYDKVLSSHLTKEALLPRLK